MFLKERVKQFLGYSPREKKDLLLTIAVVSFIFAYNDGRDTFSLVFWLANFGRVVFFVALAFVAHTLAQQVFALDQGFKAEYRAWPAGLAMGVIVALLTSGKWYLILPGGMAMSHMAIHRIGKFRYGLNVVAQGMIAVSGAFANLVLATFALMMSKQLHVLPAFFDQMAKINFWIMIFSLLPLPKLDGIHLFFMSRLAYVFIFSTLLSYVVLSLLGVYSWILSFLIGVSCWLLYYKYFE